ncbi:hypothetical protein QUF70_04425 [Desulfobacterales bacterium HSG17]|nr:hypothetical protein [Desulfobacterales bacterium HSG17]
MSDAMHDFNKPLVYQTVERIRESINRRFEKDANLYISNQDSQKIKNALRNSNLNIIYLWFKNRKHSAEILTKVILKNAWLMKPISYEKMKEFFKPIFDTCEQKFFLEVAKESIENKTETSFDLKRLLNDIYYDKADIQLCEHILENGHNDLEVLKTCFQKTIKNNLSGNLIYKKVKKYLKNYPNLNQSIRALNITHLTEDEQKNLAAII